MVRIVSQSTAKVPKTGVEAHCACACFGAAKPDGRVRAGSHHPKHVTEKQSHVTVAISSSMSTSPTLTELRVHSSSMLLESL